MGRHGSTPFNSCSLKMNEKKEILVTPTRDCRNPSPCPNVSQYVFVYFETNSEYYWDITSNKHHFGMSCNNIYNKIDRPELFPYDSET